MHEGCQVASEQAAGEEKERKGNWHWTHLTTFSLGENPSPLNKITACQIKQYLPKIMFLVNSAKDAKRRKKMQHLLQLSHGMKGAVEKRDRISGISIDRRRRRTIGVASARGCTQQFSAEYQCRTTQILYRIAMY
jgi:hypothetical protein